MTITAAFDPAKHPRHPGGDDRGGEWAPKWMVLSQVRPELIETAADKRFRPGQGTNYTRTTEPVEGPDGEVLTGTRDALLIQADEFFASLPEDERRRIAMYADSDERKLELYRNYTRNRMAELTSVESGATVSVRVPFDKVNEILDDGQLLNAHDSGHSEADRTFGPRSDGYITSRAETERTVWNIDSDDPADHPIYGYVGRDDEDMDASIARAFGDVKLTLDDSVRKRTTVTYSDSLFIDIGSGDAVPSPIDSPSELSVVHWDNLAGVEVPVAYKGQTRRPEPQLSAETTDRLEQIRRGNPDGYDYYLGQEQEKLGYRPWRHGDFIEAQIHGGVRLRDVRRIDFPSEPSPEIVASLAKAGIPWTVGGP